MRHVSNLYALLLISSILLSCSTEPIRSYNNFQETRQLTESEQRMWFAAEQLDEAIRKKQITYSAPEIRQYVQLVLNRIYPEFKSLLKVNLLDSPQLNAFVLPNGSIYINIGLLGRLDNEAQLATILAHEASHFIHQHSLKQRATADGAAWAGIGLEALTGIPFSGSLLTQSILSSYSQSHENEADLEGFRRLGEAGYDLSEAPETFRILQDEVKALDIDEPYMFSSHPRLADRIDSFNQLIDEQNGNTGKIKNQQKFLELTKPIREVILERYLSMYNYKVLLLILNDIEKRKRYPIHAGYYLAEAYRLRNDEGDYEKALKAYEETLSEAPEYAPAYKGLGLLLYKKHLKKEAEPYFLKYLELSPDALDIAYIKEYLERR